MNYEWNPEAATLGADLISKHHPHLEKTKIAYLFKHGPEPKPGKTVRVGKRKTWAKAAMIPAKYEELLQANYKFVIEFDAHVWFQLTRDQQLALVDHELCHCGNDADGCYMKHHDVEEFRDVINRHGFWKDDVKLFAQACAPLFGQPDKLDRKPRREDQTTVTLSAPGIEPITMTDAEFKAAVKRIGRKFGAAGKPRRLRLP